MFRQLLNISKKGDTKNSLGNLCQYSDTPKVKKCILIFRHNFLFSSLCLTSFVLSLGTTEKKKKKKASLCFLCILPSGTYTDTDEFPCISSSLGWRIWALLGFPYSRDVPVPSSSLWTVAGFSPEVRRRHWNIVTSEFKVW